MQFILKTKLQRSTNDFNSFIDEPLSERELDVLKMFQTRMTNTEIADKLYISVNTVKTRIKNIYFKLDSNNRSKATEKATELGIL